MSEVEQKQEEKKVALPELDFGALGAAAVQSEDLTVDVSYERPIPRAGVAFLRLLSYIETGKHQPKNPTHKPGYNCILTFELSHPDHLVEFEGVKRHDTLQVRLKKGTTAKSGYRKLFKVMNAAHGNEANHMIQLIGKPFLGTIHHNVVGEGEAKKTYANLDLDGAWSLRAAASLDELSNTTKPIPIPEITGTCTAFLWENASMSDDQITDMWNSIFIEGTREVEDKKAEGGKREVSKNWIQELIMKNLEWEGSTTQALTQEEIGIDMDDLAIASESVADKVAESTNDPLTM